MNINSGIFTQVGYEGIFNRRYGRPAREVDVEAVALPVAPATALVPVAITAAPVAAAAVPATAQGGSSLVTGLLIVGAVALLISRMSDSK